MAIISRNAILSFSNDLGRLSSKIESGKEDINTIFLNLSTTEALDNDEINNAINSLRYQINNLSSNWMLIKDDIINQLNELARTASETETNIASQLKNG